MDPISFFVIIATVSAVSFSWATFLLKHRKIEDEELEELEQRILDLMGRFKHVSNIRLELLDKKVNEIKRVIKEANNVYASLAIKLTDLMKIKEELPLKEDQESSQTAEKTDEVGSKNITSSETVTDESRMDEEPQEMNLERKILFLHDEGLSEIEIAKRLGIGVGEVKLMISLFRRNR